MTKILPIPNMPKFGLEYTNWRSRKPTAEERYEAASRSAIARPVVEYDAVRVVRLS